MEGYINKDVLQLLWPQQNSCSNKRLPSVRNILIHLTSHPLVVTTVPQSLTTSCTSDDDGNLGNGVISVPGHDMGGEPQPIGYSAILCDKTTPHPHTLGEQCDAEKEKRGHVMQSSNGGTNALALLMGQYCDSDSELEPGEVL